MARKKNVWDGDAEFSFNISEDEYNKQHKKSLKKAEPKGVKKKRNHKKLIKIIKETHAEPFPKSEFQDIADCIRSDQVSNSGVMWYFKHKKFYKWYARKYLK